jgi:cysteinyl-tRNA synthetase
MLFLRFIVAGVGVLGLGSAWAQESESAQLRSLAYVLQAEGIGKTRQEAARCLRDCGRDWIIIDPAYDDDRDSRWTGEEVQDIRAGKPGRRVLAYLSVGEAENYRPYWKRAWDANRDGKPDLNAPSWLCTENPEWKGNYRVRYWQEAWQNIMLKGVDDAVKQGFDGVYLDVVDAFEFFEYNPAKKDWADNRPNLETKRTYREDMIAWVLRIAAHARQQKPGFMVIPQNGAQLLEQPDFVAAIDAIGVEDLFTEGNRAQPREHTEATLGFLKRISQAKKQVLVVEYGTKPKIRQRSEEGARENGFVLLMTDRELNSLGQCRETEGR